MDAAMPPGRTGRADASGNGVPATSRTVAGVIGSAYAGLVLVLALAWDAPLPRQPGAAVELLLPGALAPLGTPAAGGQDRNLLRAALLATPAPSPKGAGRSDTDARPATDAAAAPAPDVAAALAPGVGFLPVLLALLGVVWARGPVAGIARALLLIGLVAALPGAGGPFPAALVLVGVAMLAGLTLAALVRGDDRVRGAGPALALGVVAVVLAGALTVFALDLGSSEPKEALAPLVAHLTGLGQPEPSRAALVATSDHLRSVLDQGALLAFLSMAALLALLKHRGALAVVLVCAVTVADTGRSLVPWALGGLG